MAYLPTFEGYYLPGASGIGHFGILWYKVDTSIFCPPANRDLQGFEPNIALHEQGGMLAATCFSNESNWSGFSYFVHCKHEMKFHSLSRNNQSFSQNNKKKHTPRKINMEPKNHLIENWKLIFQTSIVGGFQPSISRVFLGMLFQPFQPFLWNPRIHGWWKKLNSGCPWHLMAASNKPFAWRGPLGTTSVGFQDPTRWLVGSWRCR